MPSFAPPCPGSFSPRVRWPGSPPLGALASRLVQAFAMGFIYRSGTAYSFPLTEVRRKFRGDGLCSNSVLVASETSCYKVF